MVNVVIDFSNDQHKLYNTDLFNLTQDNFKLNPNANIECSKFKLNDNLGKLLESLTDDILFDQTTIKK